MWNCLKLYLFGTKKKLAIYPTDKISENTKTVDDKENKVNSNKFIFIQMYDRLVCTDYNNVFTLCLIFFFQFRKEVLEKSEFS